jgi:hypothetical protein
MSEQPIDVYVCDIIHQGKRVTQATPNFEQAKAYIVSHGNGLITKTTMSDPIFDKRNRHEKP